MKKLQLFAAVAAAMIGISALGAGASGAAPLPLATPNVTPADNVSNALAFATRFMSPPKRIQQTIPLRVRPPAGGLVVFMQNGQPVTVAFAQGIKEGAEAAGWEYREISYNAANPATLQQALLNALAMKPTVVGTVGASPDLIGQSVISQFADAKVPMIIGSQYPFTTSPPLFPGSSMGPSEKLSAQALANWFIADSKGKGKAILQSMPAFPILKYWADSFKAEVAAKCPGCEVSTIETTLAQFTANQVVSAVVNKRRAEPDFNYVFFDNAQWANGINTALDAVGLLGSTKVGGRNMNDMAYSLLKSGQAQVWLATPFKLTGYGWIDSAFRVVTKSRGIDKNAITPFQLITNINVAGVTLPFYEPSNAFEQYKRIWRLR